MSVSRCSSPDERPQRDTIQQTHAPSPRGGAYRSGIAMRTHGRRVGHILCREQPSPQNVESVDEAVAMCTLYDSSPNSPGGGWSRSGRVDPHPEMASASIPIDNDASVHYGSGWHFPEKEPGRGLPTPPGLPHPVERGGQVNLSSAQCRLYLRSQWFRRAEHLRDILARPRVAGSVPMKH